MQVLKSRGHTPFLDEKLWKRLILHIAAFLPLKNLFNFLVTYTAIPKYVNINNISLLLDFKYTVHFECF